MAKRRKKRSGALLPFAAGIAVGYLLFRNKSGGGGSMQLPTEDAVLQNNAGGGGNVPSILQLPTKNGRLKISGFNLQHNGKLQPDYHNLYL